MLPSLSKPMEKSGVLSVRQFLCALGSLDHCFNQGDAEFAFLEFHDRVDGTAGRRRDRIFKKGRMVPALKNNFRGAESRLCRQKSRNVSRQTYLHTRLRQRFEN